jgi:hypothetical protein
MPGGPEHHLAVQAQCISVYIRHEKKYVWQIGIAFTGFDQGSKALTEYFLRCRSEVGPFTEAQGISCLVICHTTRIDTELTLTFDVRIPPNCHALAGHISC